MGFLTILRTTVSDSLPTEHEATSITSLTCCLLSHPFPSDAVCATERLVLVGVFCVVTCFMIKQPFL